MNYETGKRLTVNVFTDLRDHARTIEAGLERFSPSPRVTPSESCAYLHATAEDLGKSILSLEPEASHHNKAAPT